MHALHKTIATAAIIALALSPAACASGPGSEAGVGTGTDDESAGDGDDVGSGGSIDSSSESTASGNSSVTMGSGAGDGDGTGQSTTMGDGDEAGDGDSSGDGDSTSNSATGDGDAGDGDGDGAPGSDKFPGDLCDPFIDTCIDFEGTDYVCAFNYDEPSIGVYEYNFRCKPFWDQQGDGLAGSNCTGDTFAHYMCQNEFYCAPAELLTEGDCIYECCSPLCVYGDVCSDGSECFVTYVADQLTDYLDIYTGIGFCQSG